MELNEEAKKKKSLASSYVLKRLYKLQDLWRSS